MPAVQLLRRLGDLAALQRAPCTHTDRQRLGDLLGDDVPIERSWWGGSEVQTLPLLRSEGSKRRFATARYPLRTMRNSVTGGVPP